MPDPTIMDLPKTSPRLVYEAELLRLMPGANALIRALTAAIVESRGLLEAPPPSVVLRTAAVRHQAAARRTRAAALRHDVAQLCAQAIVLQREAAQLCKPRLEEVWSPWFTGRASDGHDPQGRSPGTAPAAPEGSAPPGRPGIRGRARPLPYLLVRNGMTPALSGVLIVEIAREIRL
jgi:hypothetical protein